MDGAPGFVAVVDGSGNLPTFRDDEAVVKMEHPASLIDVSRNLHQSKRRWTAKFNDRKRAET
jgi:hypothetical protein